MGKRLDLRFSSGGVKCAAWLYLPSGEPAPVIVMAHGLGAVRGMRLDAFAERFTDAGYACLVFDYRHFGDSDGEPRQLLDIDRQRDDWRAAIDFVRSLDSVDGSRIVLWGTSFGGGHVIAVAACDDDIAAVIAQCPFTDGPASVLAMPPLASMKVTARGVADSIGARWGKDPLLVATSGPAGSTALMSAPDAQPGYLALVPQGMAFTNEVAARIALAVPFRIPGRAARNVRCPILFAVCENDSVAPAKATLRHARTAPRGEIRLYSEGHFDIYVGEAFERVVADQIRFLATHVPPTPSDAKDHT